MFSCKFVKYSITKISLPTLNHISEFYTILFYSPSTCVPWADGARCPSPVYANTDHYPHSWPARRPVMETIILHNLNTQQRKRKYENMPKSLTESGDNRNLSTGLLNCMRFNSSYVSSDHKQMVASMLPETSTPLVELTATHTTGPRWWSIFMTLCWFIVSTEENWQWKSIKLQ